MRKRKKAESGSDDEARVAFESRKCSCTRTVFATSLCACHDGMMNGCLSHTAHDGNEALAVSVYTLYTLLNKFTAS
jgi:hypothetical protein